ncbi:Gfo/Idh/MocA family oxidoreductase [bacterium]|nr:Gfo/Idh/MocA family oxidoreductase [bacterium]
MPDSISRKEFARRVLAGSAALGLAPGILSARSGSAGETVRVGFIGAGRRGKGLLATLLSLKGVEVPAICEIDPECLAGAQKILAAAGKPKAEEYSRGPEDYTRLLARTDLHAVIIATPWECHTPMAVAAMKAGKYAGVEVPAAITTEQCWELVHTHESTGVPCMMLENWSFRRDNLAVLNMRRQGLFGEIVHCHCAHSHDCIAEWFFEPDGSIRWGGEYLVKRNCDQYPTHSLGPVISWLDIGCGDWFATLASTATRSSGINDYFIRKYGPEHPNAKRVYKQGDIVTSVIKTVKGSTIVINYDMQLPRPYDNRWLLQGTLGVYNEQRNALYLDGRSPKEFEWESFDPYQQKFEHAWWRAMAAEAGAASHGGTDYLELQKFVEAVRDGKQTPIDVYDSVAMSCVVGLSEQSIQAGGAPVAAPDFSGGRWKTKAPAFALEA